MVSQTVTVACVLGLSVLGNIHVASGFGGKILGGKGARYTNVVSRQPIVQPIFTNPIMPTPYVSSTIVREMDEPIIRNPFQGSRAAVSGDIIGAAPAVAFRPKASQRDTYQHTGTMLGESLGLVPGNLGNGLSADYSGTSNIPLISSLQYPGFPRFESDGYIVHDQRGRDASTCPPGGCGDAGSMSPEMQSMYDKYKRYYRSFGPGSRAAPAPGRLIDPLPISQYSRLNSGLAAGGSHFVASPLLDGRNGGNNAASRMPPAVAHYARPEMPQYASTGSVDALGRMRGGTDRVALGTPTKARDSFFGKIYDSPDGMIGEAEIDGNLIYDGTRPNMPSPYATQYYASGRQGANDSRYADATSDSFDDLPEYGGQTSTLGSQKSTAGVGNTSGSLADRLSDIQDNLPGGGASRIAGGGLVDRIQDFQVPDLLDNVGIGNLAQDILR